MDLNTLCFGLFGFLFIGFLVLEGFDYGAGMLLFFVGKSDAERQAIINAMAPVWEGNQVWLIAAGAVLFAGFPNAYATLFSGLYLALLLILASLILRGLAFEFRSKEKNRLWRNFWDGALFAGSIIPAMLWGVAIGNLLKALPINAEMQYAGTFWDLVSSYTVISGLLFLLLFLLHGLTYLSIKLDNRLLVKVKRIGKRLSLLTLGTALLFILFFYIIGRLEVKIVSVATMLLAVLAIVFVGFSIEGRRAYKGFIFSCLAIIATAGSVFLELYPRIIVSSINPNYSLNIYNSASNQLTLKIMTITIAITLPIVLAIEGWKYYVFRQQKNITEGAEELLWKQLEGSLKEAIGCYYEIGEILEKAKQVVKNDQSVKDNQDIYYGITNQRQQTKLVLPCRQLVKKGVTKLKTKIIGNTKP